MGLGRSVDSHENIGQNRDSTMPTYNRSAQGSGDQEMSAIWLSVRRSLIEVADGWSARGLEPPADVDTCVGFAAVVARAFGRGRFGVPFQDLQLLLIALNQKPVDRV
jgi:hypothetical protein